ncbi:MAG: hypothetical protein Q8O67_22115 [Deltaproteobacteria bacterium]|nr:hypothetical protein [Deltaproteobacteria bacterium]
MLRLLPCLAAFAALASCTTALGDEDDGTNGNFVVVDHETEAAVTYVEPGEVESTRMYLGVHNDAVLTEDVPLFYGHFDMRPRGRVDITVRRRDGDENLGVGFKVYRVNPRGTLRYLGQVDGEHGVAMAQLESNAGGTFVVETTSPLGATSPEGTALGVTELGIDIVCKRRDGNCARLAQPGDLCGTRGAESCDEGLFCQIDEGCGRDDRGGVCTLPSPICPRIACRTVCGCDGVDYCDACHANGDGANVDHEGSCNVVEPSCEYLKAETAVNTHGVWTFQGEHNDFDVTATLHLNDGDFFYEQLWDPTCLREAPYCRRASLYFSMTGGWENLGFAVQLTPDAESTPAPDGLAQSFGVLVNSCDGDVQLETTELGQDRLFKRDLCADQSCADDEHCEVVQVMCIQAPCPPLPTCVAN